MRLNLPVAAVLAVLGAGWCSAADSSSSDQGQGVSTTGASQLTPQAFVEQAASAGMFEVKSSQLALTKGVDQKVRDLAQMMIDDHQKANQELTQIAQKKGITVKQDLRQDDQRQLDKLQGYTGEEFSRQYVNIQSQAHQDAVALFERAGRELQDQDLKQFAQKTLPTLQHHRDMVQQLKSQEKSSMNGGWQQGGQQSGSVGSGTWSSQSTLPNGSSSRNDQSGVQNGSLGTQNTGDVGSSSSRDLQNPSSSTSGSANGSLGSSDSVTIDSGIGGAGASGSVNQQGQQRAQQGQQSGAQQGQQSGAQQGQQSGAQQGQQSGANSGASNSGSSTSTYRENTPQQSDLDTGVGSSSQNQSNMYQDQGAK